MMETKKYLMRSWLICPLAVWFLLMGCERERDLILPDVTVMVMNYDGNPIMQEPNGQVMVDITTQSLAGIAKIEVLLDGEVVETTSPNHPLAFEYAYTFTVPSEADLGTVYGVVFKVTDGDGRITESSVVRISVNQPFSIEEMTLAGTTYERVKGRINRDLMLTKDKNWLLDSMVVVAEGATLTIEPGTHVYFRTYDHTTTSALAINRGSRIIAEGTRTEPIVFTSSAVNQNNANSGDWGGLLIHGEAPSNVAEVVLYDGFRYGGTRPADNSGTLRFVRIEYAGKNGLHALQLFGVGSATNVAYTQVYNCYNNAYRIRGGRVSLRYLAGIEHGGYGIWADEGWQGNGQFWLFQTSLAATLTPVNYWNQARSIEFRNDDTFFDKQPVTTFRVSNVTLIGNGRQDGTRRGIRIRTGSRGMLYNTIVTQFPSDAVRVEDLPISTLGVSTIIDHIHAFDNYANWEQDAKSFFFDSGDYNLSEAPVTGISLNNFDAVATTTYNPTSLSSWFQSAPYIGAVNPASDWTTGGTWFKDKDGNYR